MYLCSTEVAYLYLKHSSCLILSLVYSWYLKYMYALCSSDDSIVCVWCIDFVVYIVSLMAVYMFFLCFRFDFLKFGSARMDQVPSYCRGSWNSKSAYGFM